MKRRDFIAGSVVGAAVGAGAYHFSMTKDEKPVEEQKKEVAPDKKQSGTIKFSQTVHPLKKAPYYNEWSQMGNAYRPVCETLVSWAPSGAFEPNLATSWEYSDDGKQFTIHLRKGVTWSNGDEFNADDVMNTIDGWLNAQPKSTMQSRFAGLLEDFDTGQKDEEGKAIMAQRARAGALEKVDNYTVRLNSSVPDISFVASIADYPGFIIHRSLKIGDDWLDNPLGTGPFELVEYRVGERAIYNARTSGYWRDGPYVEKLIMIDLKEDPSTEYAAFASNQIDINYNTDPEQVEALEALGTLHKNEKFTANTGVFRFNVDLAPFDNEDLRQAIAHAVDNTKVLEIAYKNKGSTAENHHVSPLHPAYAELPPLKRNVAKAKELLAKAGYPDGIEIEAVAVDAPKWESDALLAIADQAKDAGINIKVNILPGTAYWAKWDQWPASFTAWNGRPLAVQIYNLAYKTGAVWNETAYSNADFDNWLAEATAQPDVAKRRELMKKLEKNLQDSGVIIQPLWRGKYNFNTKRLKGFELHPANEMEFRDVWIDE